MDKFEDMLNNLYQILDNDTVEDKVVLTKPEFKREGKKKTWTNAKAFLRKINRVPEHFILYLGKETNGVANWKSSSKSDGVSLSSKIKDSQVISLMQKYMQNFVTCSQCNSCNTSMLRDTSVRSYIIKCNVCGSTKYV